MGNETVHCTSNRFVDIVWLSWSPLTISQEPSSMLMTRECLPHLPKLINVVAIVLLFLMFKFMSLLQLPLCFPDCSHFTTICIEITNRQSYTYKCTWLPLHAHSIAMHLCRHGKARPQACSWFVVVGQSILSVRWHRRLGLPVTAQDSCAVTGMVPMTLLS